MHITHHAPLHYICMHVIVIIFTPYLSTAVRVFSYLRLNTVCGTFFAGVAV